MSAKHKADKTADSKMPPAAEHHEGRVRGNAHHPRTSDDEEHAKPADAGHENLHVHGSDFQAISNSKSWKAESSSERISKLKHGASTFESAKNSNILLYVLIFLSIGLILFNQLKINEITGAALPSNQLSGAPKLTGNAEQDAIAIVLAKGVPPVYGLELGVSFDDPVAGMDVLKNFDPTYGNNKIVLQGADLQRYIKIGTVPSIACEYCCGATTLVSPSGDAACGCAHSWAMRGLMAYLIKNHGSEYTDEQITQQAMRWKALFFPKQMVKKFMDQSATGQYTPDMAAILSGVDLTKLGNMKNADFGSSLQSAPNMVGGC